MRRHYYQPGPDHDQCAASVLVERDEGPGTEIQPCGLPATDPWHRNVSSEAPPITWREPITVRAEYDPELGELSFIDGAITRVMQIRREFEEAATKRAVILEMRRLGYLVVPPERDILDRATEAVHGYLGSIADREICEEAVRRVLDAIANEEDL